MGIAAFVAGFVLLVWLLLELKTSRPDGTYVGVHPYRRMMFFVMPTRNESVVYFDSYVRAEPLLAYLERAESMGANITHAIVGAVATGLAENPRMNQFVLGRRLYERKGQFVTFSMKRKKLDAKAKLSAVKIETRPGEPFAELVKRINANIDVERSGKATYSDKEFSLLSALPRPLLGVLVRLFRALDHYGLLPGAFLRNDAMYTSVFVANLGSLQMGAGYHHLYEWGTCPLFLMVGQVEERPVVDGDRVVVGKVLHLRYTYDERIDDGLTARFGIDCVKDVLEHPFERLGGL